MNEVSIKIMGRVQGVNFRTESAHLARSLNLTGWVRNAPDGSVEVLIQGAKENLGQFIKWTKTGPPFAEVQDVEVEWREPETEYQTFLIRY